MVTESLQKAKSSILDRQDALINIQLLAGYVAIPSPEDAKKTLKI